MTLSYVTLTGDLGVAAAGATATFEVGGWLTDPADELLIPPAPISVILSPTGTFSLSLLATDNTAPTPSGWNWTVTFRGIAGVAAESFSFFLPFANGATQDISALAEVPAVTPAQAYLPLPSGTPVAGDVLTATGAGNGSQWERPSPLITVSATAPSNPQVGDIWIQES